MLCFVLCKFYNVEIISIDDDYQTSKEPCFVPQATEFEAMKFIVEWKKLC